ncbi:MAG TPA: class I SAM-dependent methyltransferase [Spirochaetia bacterium]|nr:class I SAM-dependent methyltransferase [Spirochaetia bacterium]
MKDRRIPSILTNNFLRRLITPPQRLVGKYVAGGQRAADLGCGAGFHTMAMARVVGQEGRVFAADFDPGAIALLRKRAKRRALDHVIEARTTSASEIDFIDTGSIHFVLAEGLLCCMADHDGAVRQIKRILHPEGRAYLSVIKLARPDDPRGISAQEWERILDSFNVKDRGQSLMTRWALVSPRNGERSGGEPSRGEPKTGASRLPCC